MSARCRFYPCCDAPLPSPLYTGTVPLFPWGVAGGSDVGGGAQPEGREPRVKNTFVATLATPAAAFLEM